MHEKLLAAGGDSELVVLRGEGHFITSILEEPALYEWLLSKRRNP